MALKNPGELFGTPKKVPVDPADNVGENVNNIKEEFNKVEELRKQIDSVSSSLNNSLTEVVDRNLNFLSNEYSDLLDRFNNKINIFKEEIVGEVDNLRKSNQYLRTEVEIVEQRQHSIRTGSLEARVKEEVLSEVQNLLSGNVSDNIKRLEEKIEFVRESYQQNLNEGLLNEPPSTNNSDPLTPLDQNFATIDDLNKHYQLFLNRVQQQLATLGGGGAVNIKDMDDVDLLTAQVNDKYLKYNSSSKKWVGADASGGSGITTEFVSAQTLNVVGVSTFNDDVVFTGTSTNARWDKSKSDLVLYNNTRLTLGDNEDLQMWHGGTHTFIKNTGGDLRIRGDVIKLAREDSTETYLEANKNEDVKLFFNGVEKFATTLDGISVTGLTTTTNLFASGVSTFSAAIEAEDDVTVDGELFVASNIKHKGDTDTYVEFTADKIRLIAGGKALIHAEEAGTDTVIINDGGNDLDFRVEGLDDEYQIFSDGMTNRVGIGSAIPIAKLDVNGQTEVDDLNVAGVTTYHGDVNFPGAAYNIHWDQPTSKIKFDDSAQCVWGSASGGDLRIWHASDVSNIKNDTGQLRIAGNDIRLQSQNNSADYLLAVDGGSVSIFHNDVKRLETMDIGVQVSGITSTTYLNSTGIATFRNGVNLLGLLHTNDNVNFTGDAYNLSWDKADNALEFTDNAKATFGAGNDLEIHSDGTTGVVGGAVSFTSDITVGVSTAVGVVLTSPDGTKYRLIVANGGALSTVAV